MDILVEIERDDLSLLDFVGIKLELEAAYYTIGRIKSLTPGEVQMGELDDIVRTLKHGE